MDSTARTSQAPPALSAGPTSAPTSAIPTMKTAIAAGVTYKRVVIDDQAQISIKTCQAKSFDSLNKSQLDAAHKDLKAEINDAKRVVKILTMIIDSKKGKINTDKMSAEDAKTAEVAKQYFGNVKEMDEKQIKQQAGLHLVQAEAHINKATLLQKDLEVAQLRAELHETKEDHAGVLSRMENTALLNFDRSSIGQDLMRYIVNPAGPVAIDIVKEGKTESLKFTGLSTKEKGALEGKSTEVITTSERMSKVSDVMDEFMGQLGVSDSTKQLVQARRNELIEEHIHNIKNPGDNSIDTISKQLFTELKDGKLGGAEGIKVAFALNSFNQALVFVGFLSQSTTLTKATGASSSLVKPLPPDLKIQFQKDGSFKMTSTIKGDEKTKKDYQLTTTQSITCGFDSEGKPEVKDKSFTSQITFAPSLPQQDRQKILNAMEVGGYKPT